MTIDEAIAHCKEKSNCSECGKEHEQLAVWLAELQRYKNLKEQGRLIEMPCDDESEKYRWHDLRKDPEDLPEKM